jgi:RimJ/RimL family protein N-acetyltransferase
LLRLVAIIHADHIASRRVAENIGMHDEKTAILDDYPPRFTRLNVPRRAAEPREMWEQSRKEARGLLYSD